MVAKEVKPTIFWIGALDPDLRVFDVIMETKFGTTYNAYAVVGNDEIALIETVKEKFFEQYLERLKQVVDLSRVKYLILNHTEPDHSGSVARLLQLIPNLIVLGSQTALTFLQEITNRPFPAREVADGDTLDLGNCQLRFIAAPFLHWPDSMYTYVVEQGVLFTCDSFGAHYSDERVFNDLITGDFTDAYKYYFDMILGPFKGYMRSALEKISPLKLECICPGHGPVLRENLNYYLDLYRQWSAEEPLPAEPKRIAVCYVSAYGYTASLAEAIVEGLETVGEFDIQKFDLVDTPVSEVLPAIDQADGLLIGSPTINGDALPPIWELLTQLSPIQHGGKIAAAFGAYGWSGEAVPNIENRLRSLRMQILQRGLKINFKPSESELEDAFMFGYTFGQNLMEAGKSPTDRRWRCSVCGHVFLGAEPPRVCPACGVEAENFSQVREEEVDFQSSTPLRIVIVGSGAAALAAVEAIRQRNQICSIQLISKDPALPYFRPSLSDLLIEDLNGPELYLHPREWYDEQNVELILGVAVESLDPTGRQVHLEDGRSLPYDRLILATGSRSNVLPLPGSDKPGVFTLRTLQDSYNLKEWMKTARKVIVVGGGVLGLEAASAFREAGLEVTILENADRLLSRQLNSTGAQILEEAVAQAEVTIYRGASIQAIEGTEKVTGLKLADGSTLPADLVLFSIGVTPNVELAREAGLEVNRGIIVSQNMQTSASGILAAGDAVEYDGKVNGLWSLALEQGRIAGANAVDDRQTCKPQTSSLYLIAFGTNIFAVGDPGQDPSVEYKTVEVKDPVDKSYKKYYMKEGDLVGAVLIGPRVKATGVLRRLEAGARRIKADRWKCLRCGYIHEGPEPPEICPLCGAPRSLFVPVE